MTLVLSMNPFLDPEGDPPLSPYQPIWESERCTKTCLSNADPPCSSEEQFTQEPPCRRVPDHVSVSRIAYFKRKFVEDEDEPPFSFRTYCQTVAPVLEERAHVLRVSLEKMRFIDDPEAFLRRSVLVNNLLRRLRAEILLQSTDWCFPPNPAFAASPCVLPPTASPTLQRAVPTRICLAPQAGPPFRKRFRMVRGAQGELRPDCAQTCCCIYAAAAAAGHYLHLPFSMYDATLASCPSTPHSSSFFQLAGHTKLGLTIDDQDDEDEDIEEEEEEEEENEEEREEEEEEEEIEEEDGERRHARSLEEDKSSLKSRTCTSLGHANVRTEDNCMTDGVEDKLEEEEEEEDEEEEEEEEEVERHCRWDSSGPPKALHKVSLWQRRAQRK